MSHTDHNAVSPDMHDNPDAWHQHSADEHPQQAHGEVANAHKIVGVGAALFLIVTATIVVIYWFYIGLTTRLLTEQESHGLEADQLKTKAAAMADLGEYKWVTPGPGVDEGAIQIPLSAATSKVVKDYVK